MVIFNSGLILFSYALCFPLFTFLFCRYLDTLVFIYSFILPFLKIYSLLLVFADIWGTVEKFTAAILSNGVVAYVSSSRSQIKWLWICFFINKFDKIRLLCRIRRIYFNYETGTIFFSRHDRWKSIKYILAVFLATTIIWNNEAER